MRKLICCFVLLAIFFPFDASARNRSAQKIQNAVADRYELTRLADSVQLSAFIASGRLVPIRATDAYVISGSLGEMDPAQRRLYAHARPYTKRFLDDVLGEAHQKFGSRYVITSLVRTIEYQRKLCRANGNAICGLRGWKRSSHLTGASVDISYLRLSALERRWLLKRLRALARARRIAFVREVNQACFHVMVFPRDRPP